MRIRRTANNWESISNAIDKLLDMEVRQRGIKTITDKEFSLLEELMIEIIRGENGGREGELDD